jgi:hypothetical protein
MSDQEKIEIEESLTDEQLAELEQERLEEEHLDIKRQHDEIRERESLQFFGY